MGPQLVDPKLTRWLSRSLGSPPNADEVLFLPPNKGLTGVLTIQLMAKKLRMWGSEVEAHRVSPIPHQMLGGIEKRNSKYWANCDTKSQLA